MSDRLASAVAEFVAALREEMAAEVATREDAPERLLSIPEAADALGLGRSALYDELGKGRLRSIRIGRRRLIASSALADYIGQAGARAAGR